MKYAFMSFSAPRLSLDGLLEAATQYGYSGIEPRIGNGHAHGVELAMSASERREARRMAEQRGVALCCVATGCAYANPGKTAQALEETRRAIELAADVGSPRIRVFGGAVPPSVSREDAVESVAAALRIVAEEAAAAGVTICMETHDDWTDPNHVAAVMQQVGSPAVGVNWDYQHTTRAAKWSVEDAFARLQPWIHHIHFHDGADVADKLVFLPVGQGEYDNRGVLRALKQAGYAEFLSGEWINWEPYEVHLPREIAAMQALEREV